MMSKTPGLSGLKLLDLKRLLSRVHDGSLPCPMDPGRLHAAGLSYLVDRVNFLSGHDERTVRAVLVAVIAERKDERRAEQLAKKAAQGSMGPTVASNT